MNESPVHDEDGNLTQDARWDYTWDGENRLIALTTRASAVAAGVPDWKLEFGYDSRSRRVMKRFYVRPADTPWRLYSDTRFVYHGWKMIAEMEVQPAGASVADTPAGAGRAGQPFLRRSYVWGEDLSGRLDGAGGVGGLLAMTRHERADLQADTYWATADLNGNIIGLTSTTSTKTAVYDYDAFGKAIRVNEPEAGLNPVRFSSKYTDAETGLVYYGYRYYAPGVGRWLNRDPFDEGGGLNLYGFVFNSGIGLIDGLGHVVISVYENKNDLGPLGRAMSGSGDYGQSQPTPPEARTSANRIGGTVFISSSLKMYSAWSSGGRCGAISPSPDCPFRGQPGSDQGASILVSFSGGCPGEEYELTVKSYLEVDATGGGAGTSVLYDVTGIEPNGPRATRAIEIFSAASGRMRSRNSLTVLRFTHNPVGERNMLFLYVPTLSVHAAHFRWAHLFSAAKAAQTVRAFGHFTIETSSIKPKNGFSIPSHQVNVRME